MTTTEFIERFGFRSDSPEGAQILKALEFAESAHQGQSRASGDPYLIIL